MQDCGLEDPAFGDFRSGDLDGGQNRGAGEPDVYIQGGKAADHDRDHQEPGKSGLRLRAAGHPGVYREIPAG